MTEAEDERAREKAREVNEDSSRWQKDCWHDHELVELMIWAN